MRWQLSDALRITNCLRALARVFVIAKLTSPKRSRSEENGFTATPCFLKKLLRRDTRTHLKNVDQGSGQGAGRQKSAAYTAVCEHFEPIRNAAMET
jgi:hypothetical protein